MGVAGSVTPQSPVHTHCLWPAILQTVHTHIHTFTHLVLSRMSSRYCSLTGCVKPGMCSTCVGEGRGDMRE